MAWSLPSDAICAAAYQGHTLTHDATSAVEGRHRAGEKSPPDSGDLRGYLTRVPPSPTWSPRWTTPPRRKTIISAPAGSGNTSLLRAWTGRLGQGRRIAFMSVRPGQHDAHRTRNHRDPVTASHRPSGEP